MQPSQTAFRLLEKPKEQGDAANRLTSQKAFPDAAAVLFKAWDQLPQKLLPCGRRLQADVGVRPASSLLWEWLWQKRG